ncbi:MFS transporter [Xylanimonas sp. McL0601]|uniref:MFS transporter n=1 Tax=Xylanimonas sp. McL0601 TaxID=3414739 RepID=UPI003CF849D5
MTQRTDGIDRAAVQRRTLTLLSVAQVLSGVGASAVVLTGSLLAVELSGSKAWAGSSTTAATLGAALAAVVLMRLAWLSGRRAALTTGLLVAALGAAVVVLAAVVGAFWALVLGCALAGFGTAVNLQARFAATDLSEPRHVGRDLSLVVWVGTIGAVAGPSLGGVGGRVAEAFGLPALTGLFVLGAIGTVAALVVLAVGLRPDPRRLALALAEDPGTEAVDRRPGLAAGWRVLSAHPAARGALAVILVAHAVMVSVMSMTPVQMTGHGATVEIVGLTVSLHVAGMYALSPLMGWLSDRFGGRVTAAGGLGLLVLAGVLAGLGDGGFAMTAGGLILLGLGWSAATVAGSSMIVAQVPVADRVAAQGLSDALMSLAGAAGGLAAGLLMAAITYQGLGFVAATAAAVTAAVVIPRVRRRALTSGG